jgi:N-succinyl-L-ornithine transcarbamylase
MKANPSDFAHIGKGKTLAMLFFNPSLRTRFSTEHAAHLLGMQTIVTNADQNWGIEFEDGAIMDSDKAEHIKEAAPVLSQYCDILAVRTFSGLKDRAYDYQDTVFEQFQKHATVPVLNMESAIRHPLQSLADLLTITEHQPRPRPKVVLSWAPHVKALPQAVPNSFVEWMKVSDVELVVTHPEGYELAPSFMEGVTVEYNQEKALQNADFVYVKNWSSYQHYGQILSQHPTWMMTMQKMALTNKAKFMHCLPVRRNVVVEDAVLDSAQSIVIAQANNRTFAAMAMLKALLGEGEERVREWERVRE